MQRKEAEIGILFLWISPEPRKSCISLPMRKRRKPHLSAKTLRVAVHRLRKRFGKLLREQVAQTVADSGQVDDEIRYLLSVLNF